MKQEITFISDQTSFIESLSAVIHEIFREELVNPKVKAKNKWKKRRISLMTKYAVIYTFLVQPCIGVLVQVLSIAIR